MTDERDLFEAVADCPVCGAGSVVVDVGRTIDESAHDRVELRECAECRHWWNSPMPSQACLDRLYASKSAYVVPNGYNAQPVVPEVSRAAAREYAAWYRRYGNRPGGTKCLEIGVGVGHFFRFLESKGFECYGIDPGNWNPAIRLYESLDSLPERRFDMIFMFDVLEHLRDPRETLAKLRSLAHGKSEMFCTFPNKDSVPARRLKSGWDMVRPYGHLHYFSGESARKLFTSAGWKTEELRPVNALHNRYHASLNPLDVARKILTTRKYWKDQFFFKGTAA